MATYGRMHRTTTVFFALCLSAAAAPAQQVTMAPAGARVTTTTTVTQQPAGAPTAPVLVQPVAVAAMPVVATATIPAPTGAELFTQSPAYRECAALAATNPLAAEQKATEWLKIDDGIAPHHCRAMAWYGQRRFPEAAQELATLRAHVAPQEVALRSYVAQQGSKAWLDAGQPNAAIGALDAQINDMAALRGENAMVSTATSQLLHDRAHLRLTYGQPAQAVSDLDHAVSLTPTDASVLMERATAFAQLNDLALAKQDVASVLKLDPGNAKAQQLQRLLNNPTGK